VDYSLEAQFSGASAAAMAAMAEAIEDGCLAEDEEDELEAIRRRRIEQLKEKAKRDKVRRAVSLACIAVAVAPGASDTHICHLLAVRTLDAPHPRGLQRRSE